MNFADLHELLRVELVRRIEAGTLTGTTLARQTGFRQAHISNFLNRKRALSLEGLDRVLAAQNLTVDQILPIDLTAGAASASNEPADPIERVPVVPASVAIEEPRISPASIIDTVPVSAARLYRHPPRPNADPHLHRFLAVRVDVHQAAAMSPLLSPGSIAVLDRHYRSVAPFHPERPTLFAVRAGSSLLLRFVDLDDSRLILRPLSLSTPVQLIPLAPSERPSDYIVGRVVLTLSEL